MIPSANTKFLSHQFIQKKQSPLPINEEIPTNSITSKDKKDTLDSFCEKFGITYNRGTLFSGSIDTSECTLSNENKLKLLNHLKECHVVVNNTHHDVSNQSTTDEIKAKTACIMRTILPNLQQTGILAEEDLAINMVDDDQAANLADDLLFLVSHRDGKKHMNYARRIELLKDALQNDLKKTNLKDKIGTRASYNYLIGVQYKNDDLRVQQYKHCFKYNRSRKTVFNASTIRNISDMTVALKNTNTGNIRQDRLDKEPFVWYKAYDDYKNRTRELYNETYFDDENAYSKAGKWLIYVDPNRVDECSAQIQEGMIKGKINLAKITIIQDDNNNLYQEANPDNTGKHCVMVYVDDFTDKSKVDAMYNNLLDLGIITTNDNAVFKPELYTSNGMENELFTSQNKDEIYLVDSSTGNPKWKDAMGIHLKTKIAELIRSSEENKAFELGGFSTTHLGQNTIDWTNVHAAYTEPN